MNNMNNLIHKSNIYLGGYELSQFRNSFSHIYVNTKEEIEELLDSSGIRKVNNDSLLKNLFRSIKLLSQTHKIIITDLKTNRFFEDTYPDIMKNRYVSTYEISKNKATISVI